MSQYWKDEKLFKQVRIIKIFKKPISLFDLLKIRKIEREISWRKITHAIKICFRRGYCVSVKDWDDGDYFKRQNERNEEYFMLNKKSAHIFVIFYLPPLLKGLFLTHAT